jgi:hypothetical protein
MYLALFTLPHLSSSLAYLLAVINPSSRATSSFLHLPLVNSLPAPEDSQHSGHAMRGYHNRKDSFQADHIGIKHDRYLCSRETLANPHRTGPEDRRRIDLGQTFHELVGDLVFEGVLYGEDEGAADCDEYWACGRC